MTTTNLQLETEQGPSTVHLLVRHEQDQVARVCVGLLLVWRLSPLSLLRRRFLELLVGDVKRKAASHGLRNVRVSLPSPALKVLIRAEDVGGRGAVAYADDGEDAAVRLQRLPRRRSGVLRVVVDKVEVDLRQPRVGSESWLGVWSWRLVSGPV